MKLKILKQTTTHNLKEQEIKVNTNLIDAQGATQS
jgi:hypothetical protein